MKTLEELCKEILEDAALREAYEKAAAADAIESFLTEQGAPANVDAFMEAMMQGSGIAVPDEDMEKVAGGGPNWERRGGAVNRADADFAFGKHQGCYVNGGGYSIVIDRWAAQRPGDPLWYPRYSLRCHKLGLIERWQEDLSHL